MLSSFSDIIYLWPWPCASNITGEHIEGEAHGADFKNARYILLVHFYSLTVIL